MAKRKLHIYPSMMNGIIDDVLVDAKTNEEYHLRMKPSEVILATGRRYSLSGTVSRMDRTMATREHIALGPTDAVTLTINHDYHGRHGEHLVLATIESIPKDPFDRLVAATGVPSKNRIVDQDMYDDMAMRYHGMEMGSRSNHFEELRLGCIWLLGLSHGYGAMDPSEVWYHGPRSRPAVTDIIDDLVRLKGLDGWKCSSVDRVNWILDSFNGKV